MYNNSPISDKISEEILCELLEFLKFKVRSKRLSISDVEAIRHIFDGIDVCGTADDFAKFYNQHPVNVRSIICRKYLGKPRRAVLYSFKQFRCLVPASWRKGRCKDIAEGQLPANSKSTKCNKLP